jgi:hypothetical protein
MEEEGEMVAEYTQAERVTFDCVEYLGFALTKDTFAESGKAASANEGLTVYPAKEVTLEVYGHPDAQVRVYVRPHTPTLIILSLLEKIATAIELEQQIRSEVHSRNQGQPVSEQAPGGAREQQGGCCRRCLSALDERSFIRDLDGPLCINCGRELQLV